MNKTTILFPGGFKPMHQGHLDLINHYHLLKETKEIKILISSAPRGVIDQQISYEIATLLLKRHEKISINKVVGPSPILSAYMFMNTADPGTYALCSSTKGKDYIRVKEFIDNFNIKKKYTLPRNVKIIEMPVNVSPLSYKNRTDNLNNCFISSRVLREDFEKRDWQNFKTNYHNEKDAKATWNILEKTKTYDFLHLMP